MENKQDKGFTLVELLIVIVILGILATVTVFAVRGITDQGQDSACGTDKRTIETAIEAFYAQMGTDTNPTEAALVTAEFLREESDNYNIDATGTRSVISVTGTPTVSGDCLANGTAA